MTRRLLATLFLIVFSIFSGVFWQRVLTGQPLGIPPAPSEFRVISEALWESKAAGVPPVTVFEFEKQAPTSSISGLARPEKLDTKDISGLAPQKQRPPSAPPVSTGTASGIISLPAPPQSLSADEVYAKLFLAVVQVFCDRSAGGVSAGSGIVVSAKGIVLTNAHVVENAKTCFVKAGNPASYAGKLEIVFIGNTSEKIGQSPVPKQDFALGKIRDLPAGSLLTSPFKYMNLDTVYIAGVGDGLYSAAYPTELIGGTSLLAGGQNLVYTTTKIVERYRVDDASATHDIIELAGSIATQQGSSGSPIISPLTGGVVGIVFGQTNAEIQTGFGLPSTVATAERTELAFLISYIDRAVRKEKGKSLVELIEDLGGV